MSPGFSCNNHTDAGLRNVKNFGYGFLRRTFSGECPDLIHHIVGEKGFTVSFSLVRLNKIHLICVFSVLRTSNPFQVTVIVISLYAVNMVYLGQVLFVREESRGDQPVYVKFFGLPLLLKDNIEIPVWFFTQFEVPSFAKRYPSSGMADLPTNGTYVSIVGNNIMVLETLNRFPVFCHGVFSKRNNYTIDEGMFR